MEVKKQDFLQDSSKEEADEAVGLRYLGNLALSPEAEERLQALVEAADALGTNDVSFSALSESILHLSERRLAAEKSLNQASFVEGELRRHLATVRYERDLIRKWKLELEPSSQTTESDSTEALEQRKQALLKKAREYRNELEDIQSNGVEEPEVTVTDLVEQRERIKTLENRIREKRAKIKVFKGLPPNLELARQELWNAREKQMKLIDIREKLLVNMVKDVT
ncbi:hypothetical protein D9758_017269 [Tetrapyrgos nigripes]|uniref:Uncharacterized protein n=1 Tax=Tetrapyrgos nigripes TaxID=182062 RepID=A0A8H5C604_9AGAR|nr:hypothetical protein D9758_017269 [Tetrapyrgos nigripes]